MAIRDATLKYCTRWSIVAAITVGAMAAVQAEPFPRLLVPSSPQRHPAASKPVPRQRHEFLGAQSCAAASCHGDPRRTDLLASAYHFALDRDPHSQAGLVLYSQQSRDIVARLGDEGPAWESIKCLTCHAPGAVHAPTKQVSRRMIAEGVGCEGCHGAAADWISLHRSHAWQNPVLWPPAAQAASGFIITKDLTTRVRLCADCHVGNGDQQVTHDLIAAGHPRLSYEFSAYHSMLPPHWDRTKDRIVLSGTFDRNGGLELKSWLLGQLVTAEKQLAQVAGDAARPDAAWPELAHYDCFACHHQLADPSWRQANPAFDLKPGQANWGTWSLGLVSSVPEAFTGMNRTKYAETEADLRRMFLTYSPDRLQTIRLASRLKSRLDDAIHRVAGTAYDPLAGVQLVRTLLQDESVASGNWDQNTQLFLAIAALRHDSGDTDPEATAILEEIRRRLAFGFQVGETSRSEMFDSPAFESGAAESSQKQRVHELFLRYLNLLSIPPPTIIRPLAQDHARIDQPDTF